MEPLALIAEAHSAGQAATLEGVEAVRAEVLAQLRRSMGMRDDPPPPCMDPDLAYLDPDSIVRRVHADLPAMLIGGLSALLFQMLHPLAMAGVDQHSNYREDPLGRLERTAQFLGTTTYLSRTEADEVIARVRRIHTKVNGTASDGRPYSAGDPALLTWVHAAEIQGFLAATRTYGAIELSEADEDAYVHDMAKVAIDLGATHVPTSRIELDTYLHDVRPELALTDEARRARRFVLRGANRWPHERAAYGRLVAAAIGVLPDWARRQLRLPTVPAGDALAVRPATRLLSIGLRWVTAQPLTPTV
jgi:uncharacterized protein (DUF2236 family)